MALIERSDTLDTMGVLMGRGESESWGAGAFHPIAHVCAVDGTTAHDIHGSQSMGEVQRRYPDLIVPRFETMRPQHLWKAYSGSGRPLYEYDDRYVQQAHAIICDHPERWPDLRLDCRGPGDRTASRLSVDRVRVERLMDELLEDTRETLDKDGVRPNEDLREAFSDPIGWITDRIETLGGPKKIDIQLHRTPNPKRDRIQGKAITEQRMRPKVEMYVPEDWSRSLLMMGDHKQFKTTLAHELTHVKDIIQDLTYETGEVGEGSEADPDNYYNDPAEVQAHITEIVHEIEDRVDMFLSSRSLQEAIRMAIQSSNTWRQMQDHVTEANRKRVLKEVYQRLQSRV
jgi:hypothetical protein